MALAIAAMMSAYFLLAPGTERNLAKAFDGVIAKKEILTHESRYRGTRLAYILIVRKENGDLLRSPVPRAVYERARVGMPVRKEAGEPWPTLMNR